MPSPHRNPVILIVDDNPTIQEILKGALGSEGYSLVIAANGEDALHLADAAPRPDLILLDVLLPDKNGYTVCRCLKENPATREIPVIFVTALGQPESETEGFRAGAVDYISKPVTPGVVRARVRTHLELSRFRKTLGQAVDGPSPASSEPKKQDILREAELRDLFETMGEILASRDHYTSVHALRVAKISRLMAEWMGCDESDAMALELGCLVHDIGKVAIPDDVLLKPGRFDPEDRHIMEFHPLIGARLFAKRFDDDRITYIILQHHERLDGTGYPYGLKAEEIHPLVRIVMVADVYEALIARRPYKHPMNRDKALAILGADAAKGAVDAGAVEALRQITENWNPLQITYDYTGSYMADLELFRRRTYFREPLSNFFNYRYLLSLDEMKMLGRYSDHYHIVKTDFANLKSFNQKVGYTNADRILDGIGLSFSDSVGRHGTGHREDMIMLFRRGADYLIYSEADDTVLESLLTELMATLSRAEAEHGLRANISRVRFDNPHPIAKAFEELYAAPEANVEHHVR